jgi:hypothetical protein
MYFYTFQVELSVENIKEKCKINDKGFVAKVFA